MQNTIDQMGEKYVDYIHPSGLKNQILGCGVVDWFEAHCKMDPHMGRLVQSNEVAYLGFEAHCKMDDKMDDKIENKPSRFVSFLGEQGHRFEERCADWLSKQPEFIGNTVMICGHRDDVYLEEKHAQLREAMRAGKWCIFQAPLRDDVEKFIGVADILVRSDILYKLPNIDANKNGIVYENASHGCTFMDIQMKDQDGIFDRRKWHYVVIDIKYTTFQWLLNGSLQKRPLWEYFASQVCMYTQMLGKLQGYTPTTAYLWGRNFYTERLVEISINRDSFAYANMVKAIRQIRTIKHESSVNLPPEQAIETFGMRMKCEHIYSPWKGHIKGLMQDSVQRLWRINAQNLCVARIMGITSWRDAGCNAAALGIKPESPSYAIINNMVSINRDVHERPYLPLKFATSYNPYAWRDTDDYRDIFVDFETMGSVYDNFATFPVPYAEEYVFQIGVGYYYKKWHYKAILLTRQTRAAEHTLFKEFARVLRDLAGTKRLRIWHWSGAEKRFARHLLDTHASVTSRILERMNAVLDPDSTTHAWCDLMKVLQDGAFTMRDLWDYKLKHVFKAFMRHGLLPVSGHMEWNDMDGEWGMIQAAQEYDRYGKLTKEFIREMCEYNEMDCKSMWAILEWLRVNM